ncbi:MAG: MBL fold metallo-hydrolase [Desulfobacterales bacterium]|nr:MAG: MBL fold metallo-hydrolase [Desulfobacterales bacterium]
MRKISHCGLMIIFLICVFFNARSIEAACRNPNLVQSDAPFIVPAAAAGFVEVRWFGHSFFQITSSSGTKIITDPFGPMGFPMPEVWPHVVTVGREHGNHNNVGLAKGQPIVLRGLKEGTIEWNDVNITFRDALIYNVPIHQRGYMELEVSLKGAAFVFEVDGMCILHAGDISQPFNEDQLQFVGHIDVLLVPIGGRYSAGPEEAKEIIHQLGPKIAVPMHYYNDESILRRFLDGPYQARLLQANTFSVSKDTLPLNTEIIVPKVVWHGRDDDM